MFSKLLSVPAKYATWFQWLRGFLTDRKVSISDAISVEVASDWSVKFGADRKKIVAAATVSVHYQLTDDEAAFLRGDRPIDVAEGVKLHATKALSTLFRLTSVEDALRLKLPPGLSLEVDGAPDPVPQTIEIDEQGRAVIRLAASVIGVPVSGEVILQPEGV